MPARTDILPGTGHTIYHLCQPALKERSIAVRAFKLQTSSSVCLKVRIQVGDDCQSLRDQRRESSKTSLPIEYLAVAGRGRGRIRDNTLPLSVSVRRRGDIDPGEHVDLTGIQRPIVGIVVVAGSRRVPGRHIHQRARDGDRLIVFPCDIRNFPIESLRNALELLAQAVDIACDIRRTGRREEGVLNELDYATSNT